MLTRMYVIRVGDILHVRTEDYTSVKNNFKGIQCKINLCSTYFLLSQK